MYNFNIPAVQGELAKYQIAQQFRKMLNEMHFEQKLQIAFEQLRQFAPTPHTQWRENIPPTPPCTDKIPPLLRAVCKVLAKRHGFNPGEVIWPVLSVINASVVGRFFVLVKENWREPLCLYVVFVKESGTTKSGLIKAIVLSLDKFADELMCGCKNNDVKLCSIDSLTKNQQKELNNILRECSKTGDYSPYMEALNASNKVKEQVYQGLKAYTAPPMIYGTDMTLATLARLMYDQGGSFNILCLEDWFAKVKLDTSSQHINILLNAYDAEPSGYTKPGGKYLQIQNPMLNMFTLIQPEKLYKHFDKAKKTDNGFFNRVIVCICEDKSQMVSLALEEPVTADEEVAVEEFHKRINYLARTYYSQDMHREIFTLKFSPAAIELLEQYQNQLDHDYSNYLLQSNTNRCINDGYIQKDRGAVARVAALFHVFEHYLNPCGCEVLVEHVEVACSILYPMIFHHAHANASEQRRVAYNAVRIINWFCKYGFIAFSLDDVRSALNEISTDEYKEAFALLERYNWIRMVQTFGCKIGYVVNANALLIW